MEKNKITILFEDVCLYESQKFNLFEKVDDEKVKVDQSALIAFFEYLGLLGNNNLITDCVWCNGHFPFSYKICLKKFDRDINSVYVGKTTGGNYIYLDFDNPTNIKSNLFIDSIETQSFTIDYYFCCSNDESHHYFMKLAIFFSLDFVEVIKIGQYPENSSLGNFNSEDYKKELRKINDSYIDYKNSEKSFKHGLYVGAYDYLRRVYEKMIKYYLDKTNISIETNSTAQDKIKTIKNCFDKRIQDFLYPLYSALSAGVHIMSEEECKENYNELKAVIDIQLQHIKSGEELSLQINKSKSVLDTLNIKYGKK